MMLGQEQLTRPVGVSGMMREMGLISTKELKGNLDRGEDFKLVMVPGRWAYRVTHIPGSLCIGTAQEWLKALDPDDDIVVYDSRPYCVVSRRAYSFLKAHGYDRVRCYAGGLEEWESAGYCLEGEQASAKGRTRPLEIHALSSVA
jgi:3-mercaptopyruvate sulfurtransferase SseA